MYIVVEILRPGLYIENKVLLAHLVIESTLSTSYGDIC